MRHEFTHDGQRYAVELADELVPAPTSRQVDATKPEHRTDKDWFKKQQLSKLESILRTAMVKNKPASWNGHVLTIEKMP